MYGHYKATINYPVSSQSTPQSVQSLPLIRIPGDPQVEPHPLPLYNQPASSRYVRHFNKPIPLRPEDLMKTADYRFTDRPPSYGRHSFALSDITEEDEKEIDEVDILPSPSTSTASESPNNYKKSDLSNKIMGFIQSIRERWSKAGPIRVTNLKSHSNLDLLA